MLSPVSHAPADDTSSGGRAPMRKRIRTPRAAHPRPSRRFPPLRTGKRSPMTTGALHSLKVVNFTQGGLQAIETRSLRADYGTVVRVEHASVGVTDVMAARGGYLLHPRPGFTTGYDFVGVVESTPRRSSQIPVGTRVAGILPRMGTHTAEIVVDPRVLARVPSALEPSVAATVPLDAITARFALKLISPPESRSLLVQGAGGAVGSWIVQFALSMGIRVYGTASKRSILHATSLGARCYDYEDPAWKEKLRTESGGVDAVIDHTGDRSLESIVNRRGRIVRVAFGGPFGQEKQATLRGSIYTSLHRLGRPRQIICSVPLSYFRHRYRFREMLEEVLRGLEAGQFHAPEPQIFSFGRFDEAFKETVTTRPGRKTVLSVSNHSYR